MNMQINPRAELLMPQMSSAGLDLSPSASSMFTSSTVSPFSQDSMHFDFRNTDAPMPYFAASVSPMAMGTPINFMSQTFYASPLASPTMHVQGNNGGQQQRHFFNNTFSSSPMAPMQSLMDPDPNFFPEPKYFPESVVNQNVFSFVDSITPQIPVPLRHQGSSHKTSHLQHNGNTESIDDYNTYVNVSVGSMGQGLGGMGMGMGMGVVDSEISYLDRSESEPYGGLLNDLETDFLSRGVSLNQKHALDYSSDTNKEISDGENPMQKKMKLFPFAF